MEKVKFSITLDKDLKQRLEEDGELEERSLIGTISKAAKFYLENKDKLILEHSKVNISTSTGSQFFMPYQATQEAENAHQAPETFTYIEEDNASEWPTD